MLRIHRTKEGQNIFISQMEDSHLKNTIEMYLRRISGYKSALDAKITISPFKAALYEVNIEQFAEDAKKKISRTATALYPYIAEAMLRGFDYSKELREVFEREGKEAFFELDGHADRMLEYADE